MPVPAPNLYPDFNTIRLSHVCLNVKDLAASKTFYTDIVGLQVTDENDSHIYLRAMEERGHHCIILQKSDQPGTVEVMGFKTFDEADLDKAEAYFNGKHCIIAREETEWVELVKNGFAEIVGSNADKMYKSFERFQNTTSDFSMNLYGNDVGESIYKALLNLTTQD